MKTKIIIEPNNSMSSVTKMVIQNFNTLTDKEFLYKYSCSKNTYLKRVIKYGDPYVNGLLPKIGKLLIKMFKK